MAPRNDDADSPRESRAADISLVLGAIVAMALAVFVVQNTDDTTVRWLGFEAEQPLWLVLVVTVIGSMIVATVLGSARRRQRRRRG